MIVRTAQGITNALHRASMEAYSDGTEGVAARAFDVWFNKHEGAVQNIVYRALWTFPNAGQPADDGRRYDIVVYTGERVVAGKGATGADRVVGGKRTPMGMEPLTHREAVTVLSKQTQRPGQRWAIEEVSVQTDDNAVATWAWESYPHRGDAAFFVHRTAGTSGLAGAVLEGLRARFIASPFVRAIQGALSDMHGDSAVSIADQEAGVNLYNEHTAEFLRAMYREHDNGRILFGKGDAGIVEAWVSAQTAKMKAL